MGCLSLLCDVSPLFGALNFERLVVSNRPFHPHLQNAMIVLSGTKVA